MNQKGAETGTSRFVTVLYCCLALAALLAAHAFKIYGPAAGLPQELSGNLSAAFALLALANLIGLFLLDTLARFLRS